MTKERMRGYQSIKREADQLARKIEEIESELYAPKVQRLTGMPSSGSPPEGSALEHMTVKHMELLERYRAKVAELAAEQLAVEDAIETLEPTARTLLRYRYIDGLTWEEVCVRMSYSWRQTHRLHSQALETLRGQEESEHK